MRTTYVGCYTCIINFKAFLWTKKFFIDIHRNKTKK